MMKGDITCAKCGAGYRRVEITSRRGTKGQFRCLACNHVLEDFDGSTEVVIRLTVQPEKLLDETAVPLSKSHLKEQRS